MKNVLDYFYRNLETRLKKFYRVCVFNVNYNYRVPLYHELFQKLVRHL